ATWAGQASNFSAVQSAARSGGAAGVFYWEPTWYPGTGNGWEPHNIKGSRRTWDNLALFHWTRAVNPNSRATPRPPFRGCRSPRVRPSRPRDRRRSPAAGWIPRAETTGMASCCGQIDVFQLIPTEDIIAP